MSDDSQHTGLTPEADGATNGPSDLDYPELSPSNELINRAIKNVMRSASDEPAEADDTLTLSGGSSTSDAAEVLDIDDEYGVVDDDEAVASETAADDEAVQDVGKPSPISGEKDVADNSAYDDYAAPADEDSYDEFDAADDEEPYDEFDGADDEEPYEDEAVDEKPLARAENAARMAQQSIKDGIEAFKSVREAAQLHSDAREELRVLQESLEEHTAELRHRIDIEERYPQIVADQTAELNEATYLVQEAQQRISDLEASRADLEKQLTAMKRRHEDQLRPYLNVAESTKGRADDAARTLADARRTVRNAEAGLADTSKRRDQRISTINRSRDTAQDRLRRIDADIAAQQDAEVVDESALARLQAERASVQSNLEAAIADIPIITEEANQAVTSAQEHLFAQKQQLAQVEREAEAAKKEATERRAEYDQMLKQAQDEEKALSDEIRAHIQAIDRANEEIGEAQDRADIAAEALQEAEAIHATPHQTIALRDIVAREQTDVHVQQDAVDELAANERELRKGTFKQRLVLILSAVGVVIVIIAIVVAIILGRRAAKSAADAAAQPTQIERSASDDKADSKDAKDSKTSSTSTKTEDATSADANKASSAATDTEQNDTGASIDAETDRTQDDEVN